MSSFSDDFDFINDSDSIRRKGEENRKLEDKGNDTTLDDQISEDFLFSNKTVEIIKVPSSMTPEYYYRAKRIRPPAINQRPGWSTPPMS